MLPSRPLKPHLSRIEALVGGNLTRSTLLLSAIAPRHKQGSTAARKTCLAMSSGKQELVRTDEWSGGPTTARVISQAAEAAKAAEGLPASASEGQMVASQPHPSLEDVPPDVAKATSVQPAAAASSVPEPRSAEEEGQVLAGDKPASDLKMMHRWWSAVLGLLLQWWAALHMLLTRVLVYRRGPAPSTQASQTPSAVPSTSVDTAPGPVPVKAASSPPAIEAADLTVPVSDVDDDVAVQADVIEPDLYRYGALASSTHAAASNTAGHHRDTVITHAQAGDTALTMSWLRAKLRAGSYPSTRHNWRSIYRRRLSDSVLTHHDTASSVVADSYPQDQDLVLHETAVALRQAGHAAHEALAQVQHVLQDTPDAAAEVAGSIMGRPNYHHPGPHIHTAPGTPWQLPGSPARKSAGAAYSAGGSARPPHRTLSDRITTALSQPASPTTHPYLEYNEEGVPPGSKASAPERLLAAVKHGKAWQLLSAVPRPPGGDEDDLAGDANVRVHLHGPHVNLAQGLRTAQEAFKNPHAASVELAGRMLGKGNYGHS